MIGLAVGMCLKEARYEGALTLITYSSRGVGVSVIDDIGIASQ